ncbi:zeta-sarcoglycan-like, partial [Agrilus planipennis]|uniref:Zeta-sarcoglycan-like n=1 Tax=Agrilus planipennis TaxID=224129 RepID=A0A1W4XAL1_AGRPL
MGQLKIVAGGVKLEGKAFILDRLIASNIKSRNGQPIVIESSRNLTLSTRDETGALSNRIFLGNDRLDCLAKSFKVLDEKGYTLFSANPNEVLIGTEILKVTGEGGTIFSGSVQTPLLRAESGHDLSSIFSVKQRLQEKKSLTAYLKSTSLNIVTYW